MCIFIRCTPLTALNHIKGLGLYCTVVLGAGGHPLELCRLI